jgi:DNA-binding FrmR family transcriptional regulator
VVRRTREKAKLVQRVRRIRGQVEAIERALEAEEECALVLQLIAAAKGAINSLMAEVLEGHICPHILDAKHRRSTGRVQAVQELIEVIRSYLM